MAGDLPEPSPELVIIGAGLIELDLALRELGLKKPPFTERVLARLQSEALRSTVIRLRGPKRSKEAVDAMDEAEAWLSQASVLVQALKRA